MKSPENKNNSLKQKIRNVLSRRGHEDFSNMDLDHLIEEVSIYHQELEYQNEELMRVHRELEESKAHYASLFDNAPVGYVICDSNLYITSSNKMFHSIINDNKISNENKITDFIAPNSQDRFYLFIKSLKTSPQSQEEIGLVRGQQSVPVYVEGNIFKKYEKKFIRLAFTDITEQKNKETELFESREHLRTTLNSIGDAVIVTDTRGYITEMNPVAEMLTGYRSYEVINKKLGKIFNIKNVLTGKAALNPVQNVLKSGKTVALANHTMLTDKDGNKYQISDSAAPIKRDDGTIAGVVLVFRDVTIEYEMQEKIKKNEDLFSNVLNTIPDMVSIHDEDLNIIYSNWKGFGAVPSVKQKLHTKCYQTYRNNDTICPDCQAKNVLKTKTPFQSDIQLPDGKWVDLRAIPIINDDGSSNLFVEWVREITDRKSRENQLAKSLDKIKELNKEYLTAKDKAEESDQLKTAFIQNMSHEIRTPMNGIIGFSEMLLNKELTDNKRNFYTKIIIDSSKQLLNIVNNILDISMIESNSIQLKTKQVNINDLIRHLFSLFQTKSKDKNINFYTEMSLSNPESTVETDESRLQQVLTNLLHNAFKFTNKGRITLGYECIPGSIKFFVKDTGIGIAQQNVKKIFDRFAQEELNLSRNYGGAGLGLSISKRLVEMLGGEIWVESNKGEGSNFYFTIPYKEEPAKAGSHKKKATENYLNILVAEDDEVNYLYINEILSKKNVNLYHAKNGQEAVEYCKTHEIDLILMDIKMPILNGNQATKKIKELHPKLPIIAQTAYAMPGDKEKGLSEGFTEYLTKPLESTDLMHLIDKYSKTRR